MADYAVLLAVGFLALLCAAAALLARPWGRSGTARSRLRDRPAVSAGPGGAPS